MTISRTLLSLSTLSLPTSTYDFGEFSTDGVHWDRNSVSSPWVHGRRLRSARKSVRTVTGELYVVSALTTAPATHDAAVAVLAAALGQFAWVLTITGTDSGSQSWSWNCEPADYDPGESLMESSKWRWSTFQISVPVSPVQISGAW